MTRRDVNLWAIHHGIDLSPEETDDIIKSSNCDPEETAEWLPFYKAGLCKMVECVAELMNVVEDTKEWPDGTNDAIQRVKRAFKLKMLLIAIGPNTNLKRSGKLQAKIDRDIEEMFPSKVEEDVAHAVSVMIAEGGPDLGGES